MRAAADWFDSNPAQFPENKMIKYINGVIKYNSPTKEAMLVITISDNDGTDLSRNIDNIIKDYKKYIGCICLNGETNNTIELIKLFSTIHNEKLKTCYISSAGTIDQVNEKLLSELDFISIKNTYYQKDYSPFDDGEMWFDL